MHTQPLMQDSDIASLVTERVKLCLYRFQAKSKKVGPRYRYILSKKTERITERLKREMALYGKILNFEELIKSDLKTDWKNAISAYREDRHAKRYRLEKKV